MGSATELSVDKIDNSFWDYIQQISSQSEQRRLECIESGWSYRWLIALRKHLHLKPSDLEPLTALSEATILRRCKECALLDLSVSERLDRFIEIVNLVYSIFEDPIKTEQWIKKPHPLLNNESPLFHCRTFIGMTQVIRILQALEGGFPV